jgi:hypothetical protein
VRVGFYLGAVDGGIVMKKRGILIPAVSAVALPALGLALAIFLPLPEERAFNELSKISIKSIHSEAFTPRKAVEVLNEEIQKQSRISYRFVLAETANDNTYTFGEQIDIPVTEYAGYVADITDNRAYKTPQGIVFDQRGKEEFYYKPSWRRDIRDWIKYILPMRWQSWRQSLDRFAPAS